MILPDRTHFPLVARSAGLLIALALLAACGSPSGSANIPAPPSGTAPTPPTEPVPVETTGCLSVSSFRPWGALAVRTWTPNNSQPNAHTVANPGVATGSPFDARLIWSYGEDTPFSKQTAEFELAGGCRRTWQVDSFSPEDVAYINAQVAAFPLPQDSKTYRTVPDAAITPAMIASGAIIEYDTQHFALWYGTNTSAFSYTYEAGRGTPWPAFVASAGEWMEKIWHWNNGILQAPMPFANSSDPARVNVFICGTGLPFVSGGDLTDCGASAAQSAWMSAVYLQYGSTTMMHEFTHNLQFFTGGFQNDTAGPFWETHADWNSSTLSPSFDNGMEYYLDNLEQGFTWPNSRYGSFPFLMHLYEGDSTRALLWSIWLNNLRASDGSGLEDPVPALVRLGTLSGAYSNGLASFGDDMGRYAARLATGDFLNQQLMLDVFSADTTTTRFVGLVPMSGPGTYSSPAQRPLFQYGIHLIPLTPSVSADKITMTLKGGTSLHGASWRFTLASVDVDRNPLYAAIQKVDGTAQASTAINVAAGSSYFLVVTATPTEYQSLAATNVVPNQYPYAVLISGATPLTAGANPCTSAQASGALNFNWNTNGRSTDPVPCP